MKSSKDQKVQVPYPRSVSIKYGAWIWKKQSELRPNSELLVQWFPNPAGISLGACKNTDPSFTPDHTFGRCGLRMQLRNPILKDSLAVWDVQL